MYIQYKKKSQTYIQQDKTIYSGRIVGPVVCSSCRGSLVRPTLKSSSVAADAIESGIKQR